MSDEQPELSIEEELALAFAKHRTGGDVYMDGSHNPLPTERRDAADFVKYHVAPIQDALRGAAIELQLFHDLGTIAAAERDEAVALLRRARDVIERWDPFPGGPTVAKIDAFLARLDAAAKADSP